MVAPPTASIQTSVQHAPLPAGLPRRRHSTSRLGSPATKRDAPDLVAWEAAVGMSGAGDALGEDRATPAP